MLQTSGDDPTLSGSMIIHTPLRASDSIFPAYPMKDGKLFPFKTPVEEAPVKESPAKESSVKESPVKTAFLEGAVKYARGGDHAAFEVLYWHYNKLIWNRLQRLVGNRAVAEELHQETFFRAWIHLPRLASSTQFEPWLYRVAAHLAIDHLRHAKKLMFLPFPDDESNGSRVAEPFETEGPEKSVCERNHIEQALAQVSPQFRICLLLQDQWGFSQREIANLLKITVGCVGSYIYRGREQFRQAFRRFTSEMEENL